MRKPDFFIVGAPKCGTTAMAQYIAGHPDVFMARKEMHVFGRDLRFGSQFYRRNLPDYLAEFAGWNGQKRGGEASVWYLFSRQAAAEIKAFNPDARIIIMLRDPVDMAHSLYLQFRYDQNEHLDTFEAALEAEGERRSGRGVGRRAYFADGLRYHEVGAYAEQVRRYFDMFGRERVHVIVYDDFAASASAACRAALDFLEVDSKMLPREFKVINPAKTVKHRAMHAFLHEPLVRKAALAIRPVVPRRFFSWLHRIDDRLRRRSTGVAERLLMIPETRQQLNREFAPEVARLSELLNRDLSHWSSVDWRAPQRATQRLPSRRGAALSPSPP
jgi:hypothetical protein